MPTLLQPVLDESPAASIAKSASNPFPPAAEPAPEKAQEPRIATRAFRGIAWSSLQNLAANLLSFVTYAFLARLLRPGDFGLLAFATIFLVLLNLFIEQGIPDAIVQRRSVDPGHLSAAFWCNMAVSGCLAALLCACSRLIATMVHEPRLGAVLCGMAPILVLGALGGIQQAVLKRNLQYKMLAAQSLVSNIAGGVVAVVMAMRGYGVWSLVGQQLATNAVAACGLWAFSSWRPGFRFSMRELRDLWHFSVHVTGSAFLDFFNRRADDFLIGMFLGATALGYYNLAYKLLLTFTRLVNSPFNSVAFSAFSRLQDKPRELEGLFLRMTRMTAYIAMPGFLCLAAMSPDFIRAVFGAKWISATPVLTILCFIGMLHAVAFLHGTLMRASGRANWQMWFTCAGALTNVIGFAMTVHYGVVYVAGWYVFSAYLWLALDLYLVKRILGHRTRDYLRSFSRPAAMGVSMALAILAARWLLPSSEPAGLRMAAEVAAASVVLAVANPRMIRNPLRELRSAYSNQMA